MRGRIQQLYVVGFNLLTVVVWLWVLGDFFSRGGLVVPRAFVDVYIIALTYYAGDKEFRRWRDKYHPAQRHGELFVLGWVLTSFAIILFEIFGGGEAGYHVPEDLPILAGCAVVVYLMTEYLKLEYRQRHSKLFSR